MKPNPNRTHRQVGHSLATWLCLTTHPYALANPATCTLLRRFPTFSLAALVASFLSLTCAQSFGALAQQAYVKASNTGEEDAFGAALAVSGDTMVIGAAGESSNATGVNGNQNNNSATASGAAYIYVRTGTNWTQQAYLKASDSVRDYYFGTAVAVSGDTVVVGAPGATNLAAGNNSFGAIYVFTRSGTNWTQQARLRASNQGGDFGHTVSLDEDTVIVGAPEERSNSTGINGVQTNYTAQFSGAAYVFVRNAGVWTQQAYLKAANAAAFDFFGMSVNVSGDTVVVGAPQEDSNATGLNGNQANNSAFTSGAAYVFVRTGTNWAQQAYVKASNTGASDFFGEAVALSGDTLLVGAPGKDSDAESVNGGNNNDANDSGAAYVFVRSGTNWTQQAYLKASNTGEDDEFGRSVAAAGDTIVVGTYDEDSNATGLNGNQGNNTAYGAGAAYVFTRTGTNWSQAAYVKASNTDGGAEEFDGGDRFGVAVAISANTLAVGADGERSHATGVNGDQNDDSLFLAGAAYVFTNLGAAPPIQLLYARSPTTLSLSWTGTNILESSTNVSGPWLPVTNAVSPNPVFLTNPPQQFFRLRLPPP